MVDDFFGSKLIDLAVSFLITVPKVADLPMLTIVESFRVFPIMTPDFEDKSQECMYEVNLLETFFQSYVNWQNNNMFICYLLTKPKISYQ